MILIVFLAFAIASRFLVVINPAWANFSPISSMALFAGAYITNRYQAIFWTVIPIWISNLILNNFFYSEYFNGFSWGIDFIQVGLLALIPILGSRIKSFGGFIGGNVAAVLGFFILSNLAVWAGDAIGYGFKAGNTVVYTKDLNGLLNCYLNALPFLKNAILSQFFFSSVLFGGFEWVKQKAFSLQS
jgi:hypothetical protein